MTKTKTYKLRPEPKTKPNPCFFHEKKHLEWSPERVFFVVMEMDICEECRLHISSLYGVSKGMREPGSDDE